MLCSTITHVRILVGLPFAEVDDFAVWAAVAQTVLTVSSLRFVICEALVKEALLLLLMCPVQVVISLEPRTG